jgi:hypothetical protein
MCPGGILVGMTDQAPPPYDLVVRPCTIHAGRFRWDIQEGGRPVQSSLDSFASENEARMDGIQQVEKIKELIKSSR